MQRDQIYKRRSSWLLRYRDVVIVDGEKKRVRKAVRLAAVDDNYPNKRSVVHLADRVLMAPNVGQVQAELSMRFPKIGIESDWCWSDTSRPAR